MLLKNRKKLLSLCFAAHTAKFGLRPLVRHAPGPSAQQSTARPPNRPGAMRLPRPLGLDSVHRPPIALGRRIRSDGCPPFSRIKIRAALSPVTLAPFSSSPFLFCHRVAVALLGGDGGAAAARLHAGHTLARGLAGARPLLFFPVPFARRTETVVAVGWPVPPRLAATVLPLRFAWSAAPRREGGDGK